jgi:chromatin structure-remodeling complex subunit SFH1
MGHGLIWLAAQSLCNNCGFMFERDRKLPRWTKGLHLNDARPF